MPQAMNQEQQHSPGLDGLRLQVWMVYAAEQPWSNVSNWS